ncbi:Putative transposase (identified by ISEscan HMM) [Klebsiella pneumoniae]|nr:Putative transposase (identified by ISEscan HMM) [Klebsiella pneumoniae]
MVKVRSPARDLQNPLFVEVLWHSKGVSAMTLIANHAAINARVIGANEHESHYIFDLLMSNTSDIIPDVSQPIPMGEPCELRVTGSVRIPVCPTLCPVGKVINDMFDVKEDKEHRIQLCLKKPINTHRIAQHWDTIQRIAVSLKQRKTTQATLVRKLSVQAQSPAAGSPDGIQSR